MSNYDPDFREVGLGLLSENNPNTSVGPQLVTEDFASTGSSGSIILGVNFNDKDGNNFYSVGEGVGELSVSVGGSQAFSTDSGGYNLKTDATGVQIVTLSGGGLAGNVTLKMSLQDGLNAKIDIQDGHILRTSVPVEASGPIDTIVALTSDALKSTLNSQSSNVIPYDGIATTVGGSNNDSTTTAGSSTYGSDGTLLYQTRVKTDGSQIVNISSGGQTLTSNFFDTFINNGAPGNAFVFTQGHGLDFLKGFRIGGADHDTLSFVGSDFSSSVAEVLQNTHQRKGGAVIIDPTSGDAVKLVGMTKAQLSHNQGDFTFHM